MDMMEILGNLLKQKAGGSGNGADILKDILGGGSRRQTAPRSEPAPARPATGDTEREARELEEMLNVATDRGSRRAPPQPPSPPQSPQVRIPQPGQRSPSASQVPSRQSPWEQEGSGSQRSDATLDDASAKQIEQATVLVRAMVNAAKCDGQISQAEQQRILSQLSNPSPTAIQFLREEFAKPLDVREFSWSVPIGMEQQVYSMSLIAIVGSSGREQQYLRDLAHGLRLGPEVCRQIKDRLTGARFAESR